MLVVFHRIIESDIVPGVVPPMPNTYRPNQHVSRAWHIAQEVRVDQEKTEPGTVFIIGLRITDEEVKMDKKEEERLKIFCNHPKWSVILQGITQHVGDYERLKRELDEPNSEYPLDLGIFELQAHYRYSASGRRYTLSTGELEIYDFSYSTQMLQDEEPAAEEEPQTAPEGRHFFGAGPGAPGKDANFGIVTHVNQVDWKSVFHLEEFLREIKEKVVELQARLTEKQAEDKEALESFDDFIEGAAELLKEE